jgi:hypothetical protein
MEKCPVAKGIRIPLSEDRRIFTPIDYASYKWKREYNKRTAVERVNSRIDRVFAFENHYDTGDKENDRTMRFSSLCDVSHGSR